MNNILLNFYKSKDEKEKKEIVICLLEQYKESLTLILDNILKKVELRNNAYLLNLMSKKKKVNEFLIIHFKKEHFNILLNDSDPKTRKNLYVFMGNFSNNEYLMDLIKMLKSEKTNYCIPSLVLALGNYKIKNLEEIMHKYMEFLNKKLEENLIEEVHYKEIEVSVNKVLGKVVNVNYHTFDKLDREMYVFLTCMKPLVNSTFFDVKKVFNDARKYKDGIIIKTDDLEKVYMIRTFYEALISHNNSFDLTLNQVKGNIVSFLNSNIIENAHLKGEASFTYRIEFVTTKNKEEKVEVYNQINELISKEFKNKYINNPSRYEFEIRIIQEGDLYNVLYKLHTYKDNRYLYRKKDLPASINPTSAAIILNEASKYLKKGSKVLDPFCGTSTMLIERKYLSDCDLTGVDISSCAIEYSMINSKNSNTDIHLIKQNCLDHKGCYDEIISNMPYGNRVGTHNSNEVLYKEFFSRLANLLSDNGVAILLTSEISLVKKLLKNKNNLKLIKDIYCETGGLTPHLFIIKKV